MLLILYYILAFIITVGILVVVHEYGHFIVARMLGVKVLRFSVGFGNVIWSTRLNKTGAEYCLSSIPLGGYVDMLDTRKDEVSPEELAVAFDQQKLWKRTLIVLAGPAFNFAFAVLALALMYMVGVMDLKAIVGEVQPNSPAAFAGIKTEQQIIAVDGEAVIGWQAVLEHTMPVLLNSENKEIAYTLQTPDGNTYQTLVNLTGISIDSLRQQEFFAKIGFIPLRPTLEPIIDEVLPNSAAARADLQSGDKILSLDGVSISDWDSWAAQIADNPQHTMPALVQRGDAQLQLTVTPDEREGRGFIGVTLRVPDEFYERYRGVEQYGVVTALSKGVSDTWHFTALTLRALYKMATLQISHRNINGPITIAEVAGKTMESGMERFLKFLALVSLSLGIINLLPIPPLDGGHLLMYSMEALKGSPVTESVELVLQKIGIVLVLGLMSLAFFNDFERLLLQ